MRHDKIGAIAFLAVIINRQNIGMIELRQHTRLSRETMEKVARLTIARLKYLHSNFTLQIDILREKYGG